MYFEINRGDAGRSKATGGSTHVIWWTSVADAEPATQNAGPAVWGDFEQNVSVALLLLNGLRFEFLYLPLRQPCNADHTIMTGQRTWTIPNSLRRYQERRSLEKRVRPLPILT